MRSFGWPEFLFLLEAARWTVVLSLAGMSEFYASGPARQAAFGPMTPSASANMTRLFVGSASS